MLSAFDTALKHAVFTLPHIFFNETNIIYELVERGSSNRAMEANGGTGLQTNITNTLSFFSLEDITFPHIRFNLFVMNRMGKWNFKKGDRFRVFEITGKVQGHHCGNSK